MEIKGEVTRFGLEDGKERSYIVVTMDYGSARQTFRSEQFDVKTGEGEQRGPVDSQVKKLRKAMETHEFTPTVMHVGTRQKHRDRLEFYEEGGVPHVRVVLDEGESLPLLNGEQRTTALEWIRRDALDKAKRAKDEDARRKFEALAARVDRQPVTAVVLLDGDTKDDFIKLQLGKSVDASHLTSLKIALQESLVEEKETHEIGYKAALVLNDRPDSPFHRMVKFIARSEAPVPITSIYSKSASDLATSLRGLARVASGCKKRPTDKSLAAAVTQAYKILQKSCKDLLEVCMPLSPPPAGSKGCAGMLVGCAVGLLHRMNVAGEETPGERTRAQFVAAAREVFGEPLAGGYSAPIKRDFMHRFLVELFADLAVEKRDGVPVTILEHLAPSSVGVRSDKGKKGKKAAAVKEWDTADDAPAAADEEEEEVFAPGGSGVV